MNYIELKNQFWRLRRSKRITNLQADLYDFLVHESSSRGIGNNWENPFQCPNGLVCTAIGISEKSLIDARNVLQQLGLIEFENGVTKQKSPVYFLNDYWNKVSNPVSIQGGKRGGNPVSIAGGNQANIIKEETKPNPTETKLSSSGANAPGKKRKTVEETTEHWKKLVETWFTFYHEKFSLEPSFNGEAAKNLKSIAERLKKHSESKGYTWSEAYAVKVTIHFLHKAYAEPWLQKNFLLSNLSSKFDVVVNPNKQDGTEQSTGANVSTESAFSKIDKMFAAAGGT